MGVTGTYFSLRAKLFVLLFLVLAPVFGLIIYNAAIDNERVAAEARAASSQLARIAADGQSNFIDAAHVTLRHSRGGLRLTLRAHGSKPRGVLTLESVPGTGTRIQISIPKEKNNG